MKLLLSLIMLIGLSVSNANAGVLLEPYLGYQSTVTTLALGGAAAPATGDIKIDNSGLTFGARLGYQFSMVFAAVDYSTGTLKGSLKEQPVGANMTTEDQSITNLGVTVGADFMMIRPYLGYIFDAQSKGSNTTTMGTAMKLGVGLGFIPKVKINLEYLMSTFTKSKDSAGNESTFSDSGFFKSASGAGFFLGVSLPFMF